MKVGSLSALVAAALLACDGGAGTRDATGDDDDDDTVVDPGPIVDRCADPGPDAPVAPQVTQTATTFEDAPVLYWLPDGLRAVVFYFYGGDSVTEWNGPEQVAFQNQMADANIGWIAYTKANTARGASWDADHRELGANPDLQRLERLRDELIATTALRADTPIVSVGFSDGAAFSVFFASATQNQLGWPIAAVLAHNSGARGIDLPDAPIWTTSADHDEPNTRGGAEDLAAEQAARGFEAVYHRTPERTVTADVFLRNPEWDDDKTGEIFQEMVDLGLVDALGDRLVADADIETAINAYANNSEQRGSAISAMRLRVVWATHRYSAVHTAEECEFALSALGL
jgi:hypothetical protein